MTPPIPTSRLNAIRTLLNDPSQSVQDAILEALREYGQQGIEFLKQETHSNQPAHRNICFQLLNILDKQHPQSTFLNYINSLHCELESGFIMLSRVNSPTLDAYLITQKLDQIAVRCKNDIDQTMSSRDQCIAINRVLFGEYGFSANHSDINNPSNSFIHSLLDTRKGIPISLSILYILVARRCNLDLEPIALPGRFMVGCFCETEPFFIDAYEQGLFRSVDNVLDFLQQNQLEANLANFTPCTDGEVLCRCCRNLAHQYSATGDDSKAIQYQQFVHEFESNFERETQH